MDYLNVQENNDLNVYLSELPTSSEPIYKIKYVRLEHGSYSTSGFIEFWSAKFNPFTKSVSYRIDKFIKNVLNN